MQQVKKLIESFSVKCSKLRVFKSKKNAKTLDIVFYIKGNKRNIISFKRKIGFRFNSKKTSKLNQSYKIISKTLKD